MSVDVDAVNERLNGLVTLLKAVGFDGDAKGIKVGEHTGDNTRQLNDEQIEAIIKKLQQAQAEAPQILAALEAHSAAKSLAATRSLSGSSKAREEEEEEVVEEVVEEEIVEEQEDEEGDDDFDEDANYPMVGHGVSDDISVVSDLTTPTVVNTMVPEEEHYRETLPPMIVGGVGEPSMIISAPKRKNLVSQVRPPPVGTLAPPGVKRNVTPGYAHHQHHAALGTGGGAAAARRKMYLDTMAKLHENPNSFGYVGPSSLPSAPAGKAPKVATPPATATSSASSSSAKVKSDSSAAAGPKAKKKTSSSTKPAKANPSKTEPEWNSFDEPISSTPLKASRDKVGPVGAPVPTVIDDDGFLVGDTSFEPFAASSNPFKSSAVDMGFDVTDKFLSSENSASDAFETFGIAKPNSGASTTKDKARKLKSSGNRKTSSSGDHHVETRKTMKSANPNNLGQKPHRTSSIGVASPVLAAAAAASGASTGSAGKKVARRASAV